MNTEALKDRIVSIAKGFSPSQLVIIGLLSVLGLTGAVFFMKWVSTPTYGVLLAGLSPEDAAAVTAKLSADGVAYQLQSGGTTVLVPQASLDAERLAVAAAGLPKGTTSDSWGQFDKQGMTSSSFQQQVAYQRAMESTLGATLTDIDGVRSAQVHLALPEKRLFAEDQESARASVLLETDGELADDAVDAITHLVSSGVPGLAAKDVSITDSSGTLLTGDGTSSGKSASLRRTYEEALSTQVSTMFDTLLGPGHAVVRVNAEMDTANTTVDKTVFDPKATAVLSSTNNSEVYTPTPTASASTGGPVTTANAAGQTAATTTGSTTTAQGYTKTDTTQTNGVSQEVTHKVVAPGGVKRLTVAVAVDSNAKNAPPPADITALVSSAVGLDPARGDTIAVTTPAFLVTEEDKAATAVAKAGPLDMVKDYGPKALGTLLLLFVGLGFSKTLKRGATTELPADQVTAAVEASRRNAVSRTTATALPAGTMPAPRSAAHDLLGVVDDNPDEIAGMLRGWMANAGGER